MSTSGCLDSVIDLDFEAEAAYLLDDSMDEDTSESASFSEDTDANIGVRT